MTNRSGSFNLNLSFNPWVYFLIFLITNLLLSYSSLSLEAQLWVGLLGLLIPLGVAFSSSPLPKLREKFPLTLELLPSFPWGWSVAVGLLALFIRFYKLTNLSGAPSMDESWFGFFALELAEKGVWHFFYGATQVPPLFCWLLGGYFKVLGPSLAALWSFPAVLSLLAVPMAYWVGRVLWSRSFAWLLASLFALSFWPFYLGRFCIPTGLLLLWELAAFLLAGLYLKAKPGKDQNQKALALGLVTGTGFYVYLQWPLVAAAVLFMVGHKIKQQPSKRFLAWGCFLLPILVITAPLLMAGIHEKPGSYFSMLWAFQKNGYWLSQSKCCWDYVRGFLWGFESTRFSYKPFFGGILNPVMGSLFLMGLIELVRWRRTAFSLCVGIGLLVFILPAWLAQDVEMFRAILELPLLMGLSTLGLFSLLLRINLPQRWVVLLGLLAISTALDFYHLLGPYHWACYSQNSVSFTKSLDRWKAYQILKKTAAERGPGIVLTELESTPFNQVLLLATYPFNADRNPGLTSNQASWFGFVTNINYSPFLAKRFPSSQWFDLSPGPSDPAENLVLGILPLDSSSNRSFLGSCSKLNQALHPITSASVNGAFGKSTRPILDELLEIRPLAGSDPFLLSCLEERIFFNAMSLGDASQALNALKNALTRGYPAAHLFNDLGSFWFNQGNYPKSREAFLAAIHSPLNHTPALENLRKTPDP